MKKLKCEICGELIASIVDVKMPIQGSMFGSVASHLPAPFIPTLPWVHLRCPYCRYRPFTEEDKVLVEEDGEEYFIDLNEKPERKQPLYSNMVSGGTMDFTLSNPVVKKKPAPEPESSEGTGVPEVDETAKESEALGQDGDAPTTLSGLMEIGTVIKRAGGWYEYGGKNYRKSDLIDSLGLEDD